MVSIGTGWIIDREPVLGSAPAAPRFDSENEFGIAELFPAVVEQHAVDAVAERVVHARGDEGVFESIRIEVTAAQSPRPVVLRPDALGDIDETSATDVAEKCIAEQAGSIGLEKLLGPVHDRWVFLLVWLRPAAHIGVHVGDEQVHVAIVVEVDHLDAHRAPGRFRKALAALLLEAFAPDVLVVLIVALHREHVEVGPLVAVAIDRAGVAAPTRIDEPGRLGHVRETVAAIGVQVAAEGVHVADVVAAASDLISGVAADVAEKKIDQPVAVVVEKYRA